MGLLYCRFPEHGQPLDLAREFRKHMAPAVIDIDETEVYSASIAKIEAALEASGQNQEDFQPLRSMKRNAAHFAPQYRLVLSVDHAVLMSGAINRCILSLTWNDPVPSWVLRQIFLFAKTIAADVEAEDDAGNPIDIASVAPACA